MKPIQWHKLDRDRTIGMIDSVKSAGDHILFSVATSEAKCARLGFYRNLLLYRLTNYSSLPSFSFNYLGDGKTFYHLDGTEAPIYAANDTGNLTLDEMTVVDYLVFFFNHVTGPDGDIVVINDPRDNAALDALDHDRLSDIIARHEPAEITPDGQGGFTVKISMLYLGILVRAHVGVDSAGRVTVTDTQMLLSTSSAFHAAGATP